MNMKLSFITKSHQWNINVLRCSLRGEKGPCASQGSDYLLLIIRKVISIVSDKEEEQQFWEGSIN